MSTTTESIQVVLQELRGKRAELNILITGLERYLGVSPADPAQVPAPVPSPTAAPRARRQSKPRTSSTKEPGQSSFADEVRELVKSGKGIPAEFENRHVAEALRARGMEVASNSLAAAMCTLTSQGLLEVVRKEGMTVVRRLNPKWAMQAQIRAEIEAKHAQSD